MIESTERNSLDVINFTNVDSSDFEGMWGGEVTIIRAGETRPFPRFLAYHYAKHLIDKMLLRGGGDYGDEVLRKPLEERILGIVNVAPEVITPVAQEVLTPEVVGQSVIPGEEKGEEDFVGVPVEVLQEKEIEVQEKEPKPKKRGKK